MGKKVKIFLALGEGLDDESLELSDLVEHLNLILEPQNIHIYLTKWDYLIGSSESLYEDTLEDCEICMVVFGKDFGSYKEEELRKAYERVRQEGVHPSKLYVYFKEVDNLSEDLRRFRDSFPEAYGHFTGKFTDVNTLKNDFLLQFQLFQIQHLQNACPVEVNDTKVTVFGKDIFIDLMKIPFLGNNETYTDLLDDIEDLKEWLEDHEPDHRKYAEKAEKLREKEEKKDKMEKSIWSTAVDIARLSNQKCSERLKKAIELFNAGDNKGAAAILDTEDILKDAEHNLQMKRLHEEGLKTNIEELKLKIKTLENEMAEGWGENVLNLQEKVIEYTKEVFGEDSEESILALHQHANTYQTLSGHKEANTVLKKALNLALNKFGKYHTLTAELYNDLGINFGDQGEYNEAIQLIELGLSIRMDVACREEYLIAESLNNLSVFYLRQGDFTKSKEYAIKSYEINTGQLGEGHINTGISLHNISLAYYRIGDYEKALLYGLKSLAVCQEVYGFEHFNLSHVYDNLGLIYSRLHEYDKSLMYAKRAINLSLKYLGELNNVTMISYGNIGTVYRNLQHFTECLNYKNKAIEICKKLYGTSHPGLRILLRGRGLCYLEMEDYNNAHIDFKCAYQLSEKANDKTNMGICLNRLGRVHALMGDKETARKEFQEAISLLPEDHPEAIDSKERLDAL